MNFDDMITGCFYLQGDLGVTLEERVKKAAESYQQKTGEMPNRAHVNPKVCNLECDISFQGHKIEVYPDRKMLEAITWIGIGKQTHKEET